MYYLSYQNEWKFFKTCSSSQEICFELSFAYFCVFFTFLMFLYLLRTIQFLHIGFSYKKKKKKSFYMIFPFPESHFGVFLDSFWGYTLLFLRVVCHLKHLYKISRDNFFWNFALMFFVLLLQSQYFHTYPSTGGIIQYFWACFGFINQCTEKL